MWWRIPLIPALGWQGQVGLCDFEASLVYISEFRTARGALLHKETLCRKEKRKKKKS